MIYIFVYYFIGYLFLNHLNNLMPLFAKFLQRMLTLT